MGTGIIYMDDDFGPVLSDISILAAEERRGSLYFFCRPGSAMR